MLSKPLIFVAEDDMLLNQLFADILGIAGYRAVTVYTACDGLRVAAAEEIDAGIVDLQLGDGMTGIEIAQVLRGRSIPTIICSGHGGSYVRKELAQLSVAVLVKPVTMDELIGAVRSALAK